MKQIIKISVVLTSICLVCAFLLALVYNLAEAKIEANQKQLIQDSLNRLAPDANRYEEIELNRDKLWKLYKEDQLIGYAAIASGEGYGGRIKIMAAFSSDLKEIKGVEIIEDNETPGLGARIRQEPFLKQFINLKADEINQIKTITGATISSQSVINILNRKIKEIYEKIM